MATIHASQGQKRAMESAYRWQMYPGRAGGGQSPQKEQRELPTVDQISTMFGGPFDASQLVPIEEVQRLADQIREANGWSSTPASSVP